MAEEFSIPDSKRENLPTILRRLGLAQKDVAESLGLSPTAISRFLASGPERINLRPEHQRSLVALLSDRLADCRAIKYLSHDELAARRAKSARDKDTIDAALSLSAEATKTLEREIAEMLSGGPEPDNAARAPFMATPGGALAVHATNYVPRRADSEIEAILTEGRSAASNVIAPINGGTSSFLNRVYQRAQALPDSWACIAHLDAAFAKGETFTQLDLFRFLFREIGVPDDVLAEDHRDVHEMKDAFDIWARAAWKDATRVVVVIDGLDQIFANARAIVDAFALTNWLLALRNEAAHGAPPYNKLALFVALTGQTWSAAHASPFASQAGALELNKFTAPQVAQVFEQLGVSIDKAGIEDVHRLFLGHPYLTQLFAWAMRGGSSQQEARAAALNLESRYEVHWERMKSEIEFLTGTNHKIGAVLAVVAKATAQPKSSPLSEPDDLIWRSYRRGLRVFGLVDGSHDVPALCEFYQAAIVRELS